MFDLDQWQEIYSTLRKNLLRTFLTAIGVGWGLLMLMIVMGAGRGLENGTKATFGGSASNSAYVWTMATSMPYKGFQRGRIFDLTNDDITALQRNLPEASLIAPQMQLGGYRGSNVISHGSKSGNFGVRGDVPEIIDVDLFKVLSGRFLNHNDLGELRKVCVIGQEVRKILFPEGGNAIGESLKINGVYFKIVGVYKSARGGDRAEREEQAVIIPFTTFQKAFNQPNTVDWICMIAKEGQSASKLEEDARNLLKERHAVHPEDPRAIGGFNAEEQMNSVNVVFVGIRALGWIVGIMTLLAGAIGVSNIMLVVVKERTTEIGVRRAIGATPWVVMKQIMMEALVLTILAGSVGMLFGVWTIELVRLFTGEGEFFVNPRVDLDVAVIALVVLVVVGCLAGFIPASRAVQMKTVDALRGA